MEKENIKSKIIIGSFVQDGVVAIYAVWEAAAAPSSCASLDNGEWYIPSGCECYCEGESLNLNSCSCVLVG